MTAYSGPFPYSGPANPGPADPREAPARLARGWQLGQAIQTQAPGRLAQHSSPEPRVVRVQWQDPSIVPEPDPLGFQPRVIVTHGIDGGITLARAILWRVGAVLQVPAGDVQVALEILNGPPVAIATALLVSMAAGWTRERRDLVTAVGPALTVYPAPPFAAAAIVQAIAAGTAVSQPLTGAIALAIGAPPLVLAPQDLTLVSGAVSLQWQVIE